MQEKGGKGKAVIQRSWRGLFSRDRGTESDKTCHLDTA